jgi:hypothetical protein
MIKSNNSEILISSKNNNYVSKIFIKQILEDMNKDSNETSTYHIIHFNPHIHNTEEIIMKKLCKELNITPSSYNFDNARKEIELKLKQSKRKASKELIVIFFDNIEHLLIKKKQILLYTVLEFVLMSNNILFCGLTANCNPSDMMEKRVRSRFSQKTIDIDIPEQDNPVLTILEKIIQRKFSEPEYSDSYSALAEFYQILLTANSEGEESISYNFLRILDKYCYLSKSIKEIITKIKYILTMILFRINSCLEDSENENQKNDPYNLNYIISDTLIAYVEEEMEGSYLNLLKCKILYFYKRFLKTSYTSAYMSSKLCQKTQR